MDDKTYVLGSTWVQEMVWLIGNNFDFESASNTIQQIRAPSIEYVFNSFKNIIDFNIYL